MNTIYYGRKASDDKQIVTIRDIVQRLNPDKLSSCAPGGVRGCPGFYDYLRDHGYTNTVHCTCGDDGRICDVCWGAPASDVLVSWVDKQTSLSGELPRRMPKDQYYLKIAEAVSLRSTCLRRRYGAVIVKDDQIIATGYNGAARGEPHCCDRLVCRRNELGIPHGERYELCVAVHAEMNALLSAGTRAKGATLYLYGFDSESGVVDAEPCELCRRAIRNAGIERVVCGPYKGV